MTWEDSHNSPHICVDAGSVGRSSVLVQHLVWSESELLNPRCKAVHFPCLSHAAPFDVICTSSIADSLSAVILSCIILQLYKPTTAVKKLEYQFRCLLNGATKQAPRVAFAMGARAPWLATPMSPSAGWKQTSCYCAILVYCQLIQMPQFQKPKSKNSPRPTVELSINFCSAHAFNQKISCRRYASRAQQVEASQLSFTVSWCAMIAPKSTYRMCIEDKVSGMFDLVLVNRYNFIPSCNHFSTQWRQSQCLIQKHV